MSISEGDRPALVVLNWRDLSHPEGGGSERYVHRVAEAAAARGWRVSFVCADHGRAPRDETVAGVRFRRRGGRLTVYLHGLAHVLRSRPDLVLDVQNALPFGSPLVTRRPVVVLVHHVHREQWPILFGRAVGRLGWFVESTLAPWLYRHCPYVTVSAATADELAQLGVDRARVAVVHNGREPQPAVRSSRSAAPRLVVVGRLVPHKRVEHAIDAVAELAGRWPELVLDVVGDGWWAPRLHAHAVRRGVADRVRFHGFLAERDKHELLARAWLHLCPSVKEGWGIVVTEAAGHGVPTVAYRSAGGLRESVRDGVTGVLAADFADFVGHVERLLADDTTRRAMAAAAVADAGRYSWRATTDTVLALLERVRRAPRAARSARAVVQDLRGRDAAHRLLLGEAGDGQHRTHPDDDADHGRHHDTPQRAHQALTSSWPGDGERCRVPSAAATLGHRRSR